MRRLPETHGARDVAAVDILPGMATYGTDAVVESVSVMIGDGDGVFSRGLAGRYRIDLGGMIAYLRPEECLTFPEH